MTERDDSYWEDYESGPFCRHYGDPFDCDVKCEGCQHKCYQHYEYPGCCKECDCKEWVGEVP